MTLLKLDSSCTILQMEHQNSQAEIWNGVISGPDHLFVTHVEKIAMPDLQALFLMLVPQVPSVKLP